jgi:hypothetical protein
MPMDYALKTALVRCSSHLHGISSHILLICFFLPGPSRVSDFGLLHISVVVDRSQLVN